MEANLIQQQWSTYATGEWVVFSLVMIAATWVGGAGGTVVAYFINCALIYSSDVEAILSKPGGDLDIVFWAGFLPRMISINLLLSVTVALPILLVRKPVLRFERWSGALFTWRLWRPSTTPQEVTKYTGIK